MRCKKHLSDATSALGGVCSTCLRERLLSLIAAQARAEAQQLHLSRHRKSDPLPPHPQPHPVFLRSVSPYVSRRKVDDSSSPLHDRNRRFHRRFSSTPQVGPTHYGGGGGGGISSSTTFVTAGSDCRKQRSRFSFWSGIFRSRSEKLDAVYPDSSHSSSWISSMFSGRRKKKQSIEEEIDRRKKKPPPPPSRFFSRGMSPSGDYDDGSPTASGYSSDSSKWKPSPAAAAAHGSTARRGRDGLSRNVSGLAFCLSPLVRASPNHRHWNGPPSESAYSGEVRAPAKPHLSEAASFCANRSRKLADFGRVHANR